MDYMCCECIVSKNSRKDLCMHVCVQQIFTAKQPHEYLAKEGSEISTSFHTLQLWSSRSAFFSLSHPGFGKEMCSDRWNDHTLHRGNMHWVVELRQDQGHLL